MEHQNWTPVILHGKNPSKLQTTEIHQKSSGIGSHLAKLEREEIGKQKTLALESRKELVAARLALKKTQVELDRTCAFPSNTLREIEAGKLTPTISQLNRLNRELKVGLKLV
jgi:ribosome-binding protein aMBF1 (putative translation factor)